jgi:kynurenine formamidase
VKAIYLSYCIDQNTPAYGGETNLVSIERTKSIISGDNSNNAIIKLPSHIGTHIDFPFHFSSDGKKSDDYPASFWIFNKVGFLFCSVENIIYEIQKIDIDIELLILRTGFGECRGGENYWKSQPVIPASLAYVLRIRFPYLRVFGFDMISLTSKLDRKEGKLAHINFLIENEILILEDMKLTEITTTMPNRVIISPLQVVGLDGTPCTVFGFYD